MPPTTFAFIDSSHLFDLTLMDFILVDKRLDVGGLIGFHDLWLAGVMKAVRYIITNRNSTRPRRYPGQTASHEVARQRGCQSHSPCRKLVFRPEVMELSMDLDLTRLMTFIEKVDDDTRSWDFYRSF